MALINATSLVKGKKSPGLLAVAWGQGIYISAKPSFVFLIRKKLYEGGQTMKKELCWLLVFGVMLFVALPQVSAETNQNEGIPPGISMPIQCEQSFPFNDHLLLLASNDDRDQDHDRDRDRGWEKDKHRHRPNCGQFNKQACNSHYPDCCWASCNSHSGNCVPCR